MKPLVYLVFLIAIALVISSCAPISLATVSAQTQIPVVPSLEQPSPTSSFTPIATVTATLPATLEPELADHTISTLLQNTFDCEAPCFWGVLPGKTTLEDATITFAHLGLTLERTAEINGKDFYAVNHNPGNGIEISITIAIQGDTVQSLDVGINDTSQMGSPREWSAYSPEVLIDRYGIPSKVDFFLGRAAPVPTHSMDVYFEEVKLIVEYTGSSLLQSGPQLEICPLNNQVEHIHIWLGDDPLYPPPAGVPLEKATSLTMEEFSRIMTGNSNNACFDLKAEIFP